MQFESTTQEFSPHTPSLPIYETLMTQFGNFLNVVLTFLGYLNCQIIMFRNEFFIEKRKNKKRVCSKNPNVSVAMFLTVSAICFVLVGCLDRLPSTVFHFRL